MTIPLGNEIRFKTILTKIRADVGNVRCVPGMNFHENPSVRFLIFVTDFNENYDICRKCALCVWYEVS